MWKLAELAHTPSLGRKWYPPPAPTRYKSLIICRVLFLIPTCTAFTVTMFSCVKTDLRYHIIFTGAYLGFQRGGCLRSGPIRKVGGGGGGGNSLQVRYEKWGEGRYLCLATLSLITINGYNFDQGGAQALHTRARMSLIVVFNFIYSLIVFILETEGGARAP